MEKFVDVLTGRVSKKLGYPVTKERVKNGIIKIVVFLVLFVCVLVFLVAIF